MGLLIKTELIGTWVEIKLVNDTSWVGRLEEWDEDAIFISNGYEFGHPEHKGAECTNQEAKSVDPTDLREFVLNRS